MAFGRDDRDAPARSEPVRGTNETTITRGELATLIRDLMEHARAHHPERLDNRVEQLNTTAGALGEALLASLERPPARTPTNRPLQ